ncbi:MAG: DNA alkylation repair protein [Saprospirales bacterium]|nr:DNA alkylation repair protein [Saprospirales bacterium]
MEKYLETVKALFAEKGDPEIAPMQMKYMRNQFAYYGLKAPVWQALTKEIVQEMGIPAGKELIDLVRLCLEEEYRELHYFALELVQKRIKKQEPDFIHFLEELVTTKSWWDTVDWLANKMVGTHFKRYPDLVPAVPDRWIEGENIWLQRTAILFQLKYKQATDADLLFRYILRRADSKEFFIQKAAGWALREYSRTNPEAVVAFVENHRLAGLTKREGLRLLL